MSVASPRLLFRSKGRGANGLDGVAISVRIPADLLQRLANYGNDQSLTLAETVRRILELGLDHAL